MTTYSSCIPHTFPTTNRLLSSQVNISGFLADLSQRLASGLLLWKVDTHTSSFWFMMNQCSSTSCLPHLSYEMDPKWHIQGSFLPLTHVLWSMHTCRHFNLHSTDRPPFLQSTVQCTRLNQPQRWLKGTNSPTYTFTHTHTFEVFTGYLFALFDAKSTSHHQSALIVHGKKIQIKPD